MQGTRWTGVYLAFRFEARIVVTLIAARGCEGKSLPFLFFYSRTCDVVLKLSQEKIELPASGGTSDLFLSVPPFVPNGSSGTPKTTELLGPPLATDGPRDQRDNPNSLCYLIAKSSER